jgi:hypothetical protein
MKSLKAETVLKAKRHTGAQWIRNTKLECLFDQESWDIRRFSLFVHVACAITITLLQCSSERWGYYLYMSSLRHFVSSFSRKTHDYKALIYRHRCRLVFVRSSARISARTSGVLTESLLWFFWVSPGYCVWMVTRLGDSFLPNPA